ncbi:transglutaminase-like domain-containing protein [Chloroflexota bacterium]
MTAVLLVISLILSGSLWQQLNITKIQLNDTTDQLNAVKPGMDSLKAEQEQTLSRYADMRRQINLRLGIRQDGQRFITPDDPEISALVQEITGGYSEEGLWKNYGRLHQWIIRNIEYSLDSPIPILPEPISGTLEWGDDFWRMPVETIRDRTGDCEDISLLLSSMLLNYNQGRFPIWIVGVRSHGSNPSAHIAVTIPSVNNQLTILDIAGHYYSPYAEMSGFLSEDAPLAIENWLIHLEEKVPDAHIYVIFSENFYQEFSSNEEFINWMIRLY